MGVAGETAPNIESVSQVGESIVKNRKTADASGVPGDFVVLVKPTTGSTFQNFVDIMDELEILKIKVRQIDDDNILDNEKQAMKEQGIL
jgi:hypothetical protein